MRIAGLILAGGRASRMGGGDKALLLVAGRPVLDHVRLGLQGQVATVMLSANGDPARFAAFRLPVLADSIPGQPGPLAGILAGLDHAAGHGFTDLVSVSGDTPFIPSDLVPRLLAAREAAGTALACAGSGGRTHPTIALWPVTAREPIRQALLAGERAVDRVAARLGRATADWPVQPYDPFFNINTPADLAEAQRLLQTTPGRAASP